MQGPECLLIKINRLSSLARAIAKEMMIIQAMTIGWNKCYNGNITLCYRSILLHQITASRSESRLFEEDGTSVDT